MFNLVPITRKRSGIQKYTDLSDIERIFENFLNERYFPSLYEMTGEMKVDIKETEKEYVVEAEVPGFKKEDITIDIDEDRLTISAEAKEEKEEKKENYIRKERSYKSMSRSFSIANVLTDKAVAKFEDGILTITLPKKEEKEITGKKISIE
jgi:HSP20 family protein